MTREEWLGVFKKIPETMHDQVVLSLSTGIDVFVQRLLQIDEQNVLVRGRLGGTDEAERIFLVPWPELRLLFFSRPVGDEIIYSMFGDLLGGVRKTFATKAKEQDEEVEEEEDDGQQPMRLPAASAYDQDEAEVPKPAGMNLDEVRKRLLQPRKAAPRTETNKPGPGKPSPGTKPVK